MPGFYALYRYGLTEVLDTDSQAGKPTQPNVLQTFECPTQLSLQEIQTS